MSPSELIKDAHECLPDEPVPLGESHPDTLVEALVFVRASLDRLSELLALATIQRSSALNALRAAEAATSDAWDKAATAPRSVRRQEFEGAKERYSDFNLATIEHRMTERTCREGYESWSAAKEVVQGYYRSLDGARMDLHIRLRTLQFESSLER